MNKHNVSTKMALPEVTKRDIALLTEIRDREELIEDDRRWLDGNQLDRCVVMENDGLIVVKDGWYVITDLGRAVLDEIASRSDGGQQS